MPLGEHLFPEAREQVFSQQEYFSCGKNISSCGNVNFFLSEEELLVPSTTNSHCCKKDCLLAAVE